MILFYQQALITCTGDIYKSLSDMPTKRSDAQPLVELEKHFECLPVEISRS